MKNSFFVDKYMRLFLITFLLLLCSTQAFAKISIANPSKVGLGEPFLVRVTSDIPLKSVNVEFLGKSFSPEVRTWDNKSVALAMLGTDVLYDKSSTKIIKLSVTANNSTQVFERKVKVYNKKYIVQRLTVAKKMVTPPKEVYDRIGREIAEVKEIKKTESATREWYLPLSRPVNGSTSSPYGAKRILNGKPKNPHRGLDFRGKTGTPIKAMADGKVILVKSHYYAGNCIYIDHGNGLLTLYFHLSKFGVKEGEMVKRGQVIGKIGSTGRVTGPHLHLSVSVHGRLVDPRLLIEKNTDQLLGLK